MTDLPASWNVYLVETMTGRVHTKLEAANGGSWMEKINSTSEMEVTLPTPWLLKQPYKWWRPWSASLMVTFDDVPIVAGPIVAEPEGDPDMSTLKAEGILSILWKRMVTDRFYRPGEEEALNRSMASFEGNSLGNLAWRFVQKAMERPAGYLPIVNGGFWEEQNRQRNFRGFNVANNQTGNRVELITGVINGPDIAFRPRWTSERHEQIEWVMCYGSEATPTIDQSHTYVLDATSSFQDVLALKATAEWNPLHRIYATGAGEDEAILHQIVDMHIDADDNMPYLEESWSDAGIENNRLLLEKAQGKLQASRERIVQVQLQVNIGSQEMPLGTWWAGDLHEVIWPEGWTQLSKGQYAMRVLQRSGKLGSDNVDVEYLKETTLVW